MWLVLVADLTHQLLENIFDRHQPGRPAVFVEHDGDVYLLNSKFAQQILQRLGFRNENGRPHRRANLKLLRRQAQVFEQIARI